MSAELKKRTQKFAIDCWHLCAKIPKSREFNAYVNQLIRCSSSVGANFRASQRAKSTADFIYKLKIVEEETDECMYWLEMFIQISDSHQEEMKRLHSEASELLAIMVSSINTVRKKQKLK